MEERGPKGQVQAARPPFPDGEALQRSHGRPQGQVLKCQQHVGLSLRPACG